MAPNKKREGDLRTRKMKLNTFINEDFRVGDAGQAGLPLSTKTMLHLLGTAGDDGRLLTIPSTLAKFSKFVTNAHIFGSKIQLLSLIRLCEQFGTDYLGSKGGSWQSQWCFTSWSLENQWVKEVETTGNRLARKNIMVEIGVSTNEDVGRDWCQHKLGNGFPLVGGRLSGSSFRLRPHTMVNATSHTRGC